MDLDFLNPNTQYASTGDQGGDHRKPWSTDKIKLLNVAEKLLLDSLVTKSKTMRQKTMVYRVKLVANCQPSPTTNKNSTFHNPSFPSFY